MRNHRWATCLVVSIGLLASFALGCSGSSKPAAGAIDSETGGRIDPATGKPAFINDPSLQKQAGGQQIPAAPKMPASLKGKAGTK
jgi:hypothetical protein